MLAFRSFMPPPITIFHALFRLVSQSKPTALVISTLNIFMSFYAIVTVTAIVTYVISLMHLYGWTWGISEFVTVVLIVGFAVNYVVHLANAYIESRNSGRYRRSRDVSHTNTPFLTIYFAQPALKVVAQGKYEGTNRCKTYARLPAHLYLQSLLPRAAR